MKIAVASESKDENLAKVSPISGRASYYLIYDDKEFVKAIKNPFKIGGGGAGPAVAQMLTNEGVELIISGKLGEKMIGVLNSNGIKYQVSEEVLIKDLIRDL
ncbi:MAG: hypothetical protein PF569_08880 [Candidatus Woesearchaeota archaeon]|jgi:predicted Fe-Mo cluster-binding NifX family protein|nr:hypothetical protein [Candidatus Woesearchaeota archaeon]